MEIQADVILSSLTPSYIEYTKISYDDYVYQDLGNFPNELSEMGGGIVGFEAIFGLMEKYPPEEIDYYKISEAYTKNNMQLNFVEQELTGKVQGKDGEPLIGYEVEFFLTNNSPPNASLREKWAKRIGVRVDADITNGYTELLEILSFYERFCKTTPPYERLSEVVEKIQAMCKKYGLPLFVTANETATPLQNNMYIPYEANDSLHYGFLVRSFLERVQDIYCLYLFFYCNVYYNTTATKYKREEMLMDMRRHYGRDVFAPSSTNCIEENSLNTPEEIIDKISNRYTPGIQIRTKRDKNEEFVYTRRADCLMTALAYQMTSLILMGNKASERGRLHPCERCNVDFLRVHRNKRYCPICDKPFVRTKECRDKKDKNARSEM